MTTSRSTPEAGGSTPFYEPDTQAKGCTQGEGNLELCGIVVASVRVDAGAEGAAWGACLVDMHPAQPSATEEGAVRVGWEPLGAAGSLWVKPLCGAGGPGVSVMGLPIASVPFGILLCTGLWGCATRGWLRLSE